jgi:hypothetical protein
MTTMSNLLQVPGKARSKKDSSSFGSIPTLMALDEEEINHSPTSILDANEKDITILTTKNDFRKYSDSNLPSPTFSDLPEPYKKTKASRRSSLGFSLLIGGNKSDSNKNGGKRRSSLAAILGRRNSKVCLSFYFGFNFFL